MKEEELRKHVRCAVCGKPIGACLPSFWKVNIEHLKLDIQAIDDLQRLTLTLGDPKLASEVKPDVDLANQVGRDYSLSICEAHTKELFAFIKLCKYSSKEQ